MLESVFNKVAALKKTPAQVFSYGIYEIFTNLYFEEMHFYHLRMLLTIPLVLQYDPLSVSAKFCLLSSGMYFSLVLFQSFSFFTPSKRTQK